MSGIAGKLLLITMATTRILGVHSWCEGLVPSTDSLVVNMTILENKAVALGCPESNPYISTGDGRVFVSECKGDSWSPGQQVNCSSTAIGPEFTLDPCDGAPTALNNSELFGEKLTVDNMDIAYFMKCQAGLQWISGSTVQVSACQSGVWSDVLDMCVPSCNPPRDCSELYVKGFNADGLYNVVPSGEMHHDDIQVWCTLNETTVNWAEGGWTIVARKGSSLTQPSNSPDLNLNQKYFMGFFPFVSLFQEIDGTPRPQTIQFLLEMSDSKLYHATYKDVVINASGAIISAGDYMGDAGDSFTPNMQWNWDNTHQWFADSATPAGASFFGEPDSPLWPSLVGLTINTATIRIRPSSFDTSTSCPPLKGVYNPLWLTDHAMLGVDGVEVLSKSEVSVTVPLSRAEGANVTYACKGPFYREPVTGNTQGFITCIPGTDPNTFQWSSQITLPCQATCPTDFNLALDKASCYYFSDVPEPHGVVGAAMRCMEKNSSLAFIRDEADLTALLDGKFYFTTHAMPGTSGAATHGNITDYCDANTGAVCEETPTEDCAVVGKSNYQYQSCVDAASHYACMYPPYCPGDYKEYKGGCYQAVKDFGTTPLEALTHCGTLGGALAVPPDVATMEFLDLLVKKLQNGTSVLPTPALIGLNNAMNGDFTQSGLYTVGDDVIALATGPEPYYTLNVQETSADLEMVSVPIDKADLTTAVCQFPGYSKCTTEPPLPSATMYRVWDNSSALGTAVAYNCYPGYFVNGNISLANNTVTCYGQLGEWLPSGSASCIVVDVCNDTTLPTYDQVVVTKGANHTHLNGTVHFACPAGMGASVNESTVTEQNSTCIATLDPVEPFAFGPMAAPCNVCLAEPIIVNATSDWVNTTVWYINTTVTVTCNPGSEWVLLNDTQVIRCTATGWTVPMPCYPVCADLPPPAGSNMTSSNLTSNKLGATFTYDCEPGYHFNPTPQYPDLVTSKTLTCSSNMTWQPADYNLTQCVQLCLGNPQGQPVNGNTSWDGIARAAGTQVTLSCPPGQKLGDGNETKALTCQVNGNWTTENLDLMICRTPMTVPLPALPPEMEMEGLPPGGLIWQGLEINFTCPNNTMNTDGRTHLTLIYNGTQWLGHDPNFACLNTCQSDPMPPYNTIQYNYTGVRAIGSVVAYYCAAGRFINLEAYYYSFCDGEGWNLTDLPMCEYTTPGPPTEPPVILPTLPPYDPSYPATSDYYWGTIQNNMTDANEKEDNYATTDGPFGFGYAVSLSSNNEQCMIHESYQVGEENCTRNPKQCADGFSFSVWEKALISEDHFGENASFSESDHKYILSTGGDDAGHPGVALYHKGYWLGAVVSTGDKFWKVEVAGIAPNDTWSNIAVRWEPPTESGEKGLELFVDLKKVGQRIYGTTASPLAPLDPALVMIGCHKTSTDTAYRGYNDAEYDEVAMWKRRLADNETNFFFGGFEANFSDVSADDFNQMINNVDLSDPDQRASAVEILKKITFEEPTPSVAPEPTSSSSTSSSSSTAVHSTASSPTASSATVAPPSDEQMARHTSLVELIEKFTSNTSIPKRINTKTHEGMMDILDSVSNLFLPSSFEKWRELQKEKPGSSKVTADLGNWLMGVSKAIVFNNGSEPYKTTKSTETILTETHKIRAGELKSLKNFYEFPEYKLLPDIRKRWNLPYDRSAVPTNLFEDSRCDSRALNIISTLYDTYDDVAPTRVNRNTMDKYLEYELDSRVMSVRAETDPVLNKYRMIDSKAPPCIPKLGKQNPIRLKFEHKVKQYTMRNLKFHSNETVIEINQRICGWFNPAIGEYGAWDRTGCKMLMTTAEYTKCACEHFGTYAIIAEQVEPREVPDEQLWLTITKYIGYILSFIALIIYIVTILVSGDLKDMFHLIGLNLAVAVFFGSIFMLVSDMDTIRDDRHICAAMGTLIQVFYLGAGAWIFVLGHASFKAITAGVISGRLRAYFFLAWSVPLMSMGLTYLLFFHDLGLDPRCFMSWVNEPKYCFFGPQIFFCAVAFIFGCIVICNMSTPALRKDNLIDDYGSFCYGGAFVMIFFAITWTFGLLAYVRFHFREVDFYPIFQVFNSWMGLIILLFIGFGSRRFRMTLAGQAKARREALFGNAFGTPAVPIEDRQHLGSPVDQRSKSATPSVSGRSSPERASSAGPEFPNKPPSTGMARASSAGQEFPNRPSSMGVVAGRPGSRPNSGF